MCVDIATTTIMIRLRQSAMIDKVDASDSTRNSKV